MRSSDAIYRDLDNLEQRIQKYEGIVSILKREKRATEDLWRRALDKQKPRTKVNHIKSVATGTSINSLGYTWTTTILHNGNELSFVSHTRPVVKNGKKVPGARRITESYDIITDKYPEILGGSMNIKDEFLELIRLTKESKPISIAFPESSSIE